MSRIFKLFLLTLISLTSLNAINFSSLSDWTYTTSLSESFLPVGINASQVSDVRILNSQYLRIGDDIYTYNEPGEYIFNTELANQTGYFLQNAPEGAVKELYRYETNFEKYKIPCQKINQKILGCSRSYTSDMSGVSDVEFSYYEKILVNKISSCQPGEHFNTNTMSCQSCPEGQKWDQKRNMCWKDCTNIDKNMYGFFDYTVSGKCYDCSHAKTTGEVYKCLCGGKGYGVPNELTDVGDINGDGCRFNGTCSNGYRFPYTDPSCKKPKDPKPDDNNNTKPNQNDNNSTKPNDSGNSGNSGGGNSGNSGGDNNGQENNNDDDSGGGGPGGSEFCKKNPNHESCKENENDKFCKDNPKDPKCKLSEFCKKNPNHKSCKPGKPGGDGNTTIIDNSSSSNGNGDDEKAVFNEGDFKDGGLDKEREGLYGSIKDHISNNFSKFDNISDGINQFIANVEGKGFDRVQGNIKKNCPFSIDMPLPNGSTKVINVDYCDVISPVSEVSYYAFYVGFAVGGFLLFLKLLMFAF